MNSDWVTESYVYNITMWVKLAREPASITVNNNPVAYTLEEDYIQFDIPFQMQSEVRIVK